MNTTKKITKREKFNALLAMLESVDPVTTIAEGITAEDLTAFVAHEIELLNNKNAVKGEKKPTEKQKQNADIGESVYEYLAECGESKTCSQLLKVVPNLPEDMSLPRMTHIVTALVADKRVERYVEKRVAYFKAI
jgi:hypothetical protein